ncbi:DUF4189 domain-containing protein [Variovorax sp. JS1663]|uniref:DUF4189 domain-containing protein n=1 Tax=Variovorax sp. JS1663 TaxID=1851577 RepID=UPI000B347D07|nr:DUF4189 domain-containing protein [Variovorax sp. JS1663]OUL99078.1 hypothetical protein A8M77_28035 [Variovorax sp. JS1663]
MRFRFVSSTLLSCCFFLIGSAHAQTGSRPSWGAIATLQGWYGYAYDQPTRDAAENAARARCERAAGRAGACIVRAYFDRACGALATGNYGEWGTAIAPTAEAAGKGAAAQCESHLPTEPCKVVVRVCSR